VSVCVCVCGGGGLLGPLFLPMLRDNETAREVWQSTNKTPGLASKNESNETAVGGLARIIGDFDLRGYALGTRA
jgi:hypothetical protein